MEAGGASGGQWVPRGPGPGPSLPALLSQLPSSATVRYRGPGIPPWGAPEPCLEQSGQGHQARGKAAPATSPEEPPESQALRELPWPMEAKRYLWKRQGDRPTKQVVGMRGSKGALLLGRAWAPLAGIPKMLEPWRTTLMKIGGEWGPGTSGPPAGPGPGPTDVPLFPPGQYGAGTESYFRLLRFLLGLNILGALFQGALTLLPLFLLGPLPQPPSPGVSQPCGSYDPRPGGLVDYPTLLTNLLSGEGHLEWSPLFYGFYPVQLRGGTFQLPLAYLLSTFVSGLLCLLLILRRWDGGRALFPRAPGPRSPSHKPPAALSPADSTPRSVSGLKQTLLSESGALTSYSHRIFSAWDFRLQGAGPAELRRRALRYELQVTGGTAERAGPWTGPTSRGREELGTELRARGETNSPGLDRADSRRSVLPPGQVELEEAAARKSAEARSRGQWAALWGARTLLNLLMLALLGAAFYGIYWATDPDGRLQNDRVVQEVPILKLLVAYLPSIFMSGANLILPPVLGLLTGLEGYTRSRQVQLILLRTVFLRLASLVVLLGSLWKQITCGGNPEAEACATCGYAYRELPCWETRLGQEMYKLLLFDLLTCLAVPLLVQFPRKLLGSMCGGPLGRLLGTLEFQVPDEVLGLVYGQTLVWVGGFYCPLLALLNTAKFLLLFYLKRFTLFTFFSPASRTFRASTANFFFPLVLLLGLALSAVPVLYGIFVIPPSKLCGPFQGQVNIWASIPNAIQGLSQGVRDFLFSLGTLSFAVPLMLASSILMVYTLTLASSYGRLVSTLKGHIKMESESKVLLAKRIVELGGKNHDLH
ncbi:transmembrane channel-like protein 4 isoform X2 [Monodelphis domestica]|uniref:transmembrane channel-like protein 4 isoform X2 n=1 Tax=Monodelphis domestica TaxID=13616 RepID=UPI0024E25241|nr:transmembrane channel-like protein 4 isoform X2 [Monodelphis domestica]